MPIQNSYQDSFNVRNTSNKTVTLGDLVNVSIKPGQTVDLLSYPRVTKEKINQSSALQAAFRSGILVRIQATKPFPQTLESLYDGGSSSTSGGGSGVLGATGNIGPTGNVGPAGNIGPTGNQGPPGPVGASGSPYSGVINRTGSSISSVELNSGVTYVFYRDGNGLISSIENGTNTWTFSRDGDNRIESWTVS